MAKKHQMRIRRYVGRCSKIPDDNWVLGTILKVSMVLHKWN